MNADEIISRLKKLAAEHDDEPRYRLAFHVGLLEGQVMILCNEIIALQEQVKFHKIFTQQHITTLKEIHESLSSD
jgi:hypothetical protein